MRDYETILTNINKKLRLLQESILDLETNIIKLEDEFDRTRSEGTCFIDSAFNSYIMKDPKNTENKIKHFKEILDYRLSIDS